MDIKKRGIMKTAREAENGFEKEVDGEDDDVDHLTTRTDEEFTEFIQSLNVEDLITTFSRLQTLMDAEQARFDHLTNIVQRSSSSSSTSDLTNAKASRDLVACHERLASLMRRNVACFEQSKFIVPVDQPVSKSLHNGNTESGSNNNHNPNHNSHLSSDKKLAGNGPTNGLSHHSRDTPAAAQSVGRLAKVFEGGSNTSASNRSSAVVNPPIEGTSVSSPPTTATSSFSTSSSSSSSSAVQFHGQGQVEGQIKGKGQDQVKEKGQGQDLVSSRGVRRPVSVNLVQERSNRTGTGDIRTVTFEREGQTVATLSTKRSRSQEGRELENRPLVGILKKKTNGTVPSSTAIERSGYTKDNSQSCNSNSNLQNCSNGTCSNNEGSENIHRSNGSSCDTDNIKNIVKSRNNDSNSSNVNITEGRHQSNRINGSVNINSCGGIESSGGSEIISSKVTTASVGTRSGNISDVKNNKINTSNNNNSSRNSSADRTESPIANVAATAAAAPAAIAALVATTATPATVVRVTAGTAAGPQTVINSIPTRPAGPPVVGILKRPSSTAGCDVIESCLTSSPDETSDVISTSRETIVKPARTARELLSEGESSVEHLNKSNMESALATEQYVDDSERINFSAARKMFQNNAPNTAPALRSSRSFEPSRSTTATGGRQASWRNSDVISGRGVATVDEAPDLPTSGPPPALPSSPPPTGEFQTSVLRSTSPAPSQGVSAALTDQNARLSVTSDPTISDSTAVSVSKIKIQNKRGDTSDLRWLNHVQVAKSPGATTKAGPGLGGSGPAIISLRNGTSPVRKSADNTWRTSVDMEKRAPDGGTSVTTTAWDALPSSATNDKAAVTTSQNAMINPVQATSSAIAANSSKSTAPTRTIVSLRKVEGSGSLPPSRMCDEMKAELSSFAVDGNKLQSGSNAGVVSGAGAGAGFGSGAAAPVVSSLKIALSSTSSPSLSSTTPSLGSTKYPQPAITRSLMDQIKSFSSSGENQEGEGRLNKTNGLADDVTQQNMGAEERVVASDRVARLYMMEKSEDAAKLSVIGQDRTDGGASEDEDMVERVTLKNWDPTSLLKQLYHIDIHPEPLAVSKFVNMAGYMEKLPIMKTKDTFLKTWKRHYFRAENGDLHYSEGGGVSEDGVVKETGHFKLSGGKVEEIGPLMLGVEDGRGHYLILRCPTEKDFADWFRSLRSQAFDVAPTCWVKPVLHSSPAPQSRKVVVIELGSCSIRAGILGQSASLPDIFVPTIVATDRVTGKRKFFFDAWTPDVRASSVLSYPVRPTVKVDKYSIDWDVMPELFERLFQLLSVNPQQYAMMFSVPTNLNDKMKSQFMDLFIKRFGVVAVHMQSQTILSLYSYSSTSGVVVDIGDRIEILPVTDGYVVDGGVARLAYGGQKITDRFNTSLMERKYRFFTDVEFQIVRHAMEKLCYVSANFSKDLEAFRQDPGKYRATVPLDEFDLPRGTWSEVSNDVDRFKSVEGLFDMTHWGIDNPPIHKMIQRAIQACPIDSRRQMWRSIYLSGGVTQLPGFAERLEAELDNLTPPTVAVQVHASPNRYHSSYIGACSLAAMDGFFERACISAEEWKRDGPSILQKWSLS